MSQSIREQHQKWAALIVSQKATTGAISQTSDDLINVNKNQLLDGMGSDGLPLPSYADINSVGGYGAYKYSKNPRNDGRYDMYDTGASFYGIYANISPKGIVLKTSGYAQSYDDGLVENKGYLKGKIFGVYQSKYLDDYRNNILYPLSIQIIKAETGL